jgi:hypothetical protein
MNSAGTHNRQRERSRERAKSINVSVDGIICIKRRDEERRDKKETTCTHVKMKLKTKILYSSLIHVKTNFQRFQLNASINEKIYTNRICSIYFLLNIIVR